ncbi:outer membrane beta-barrel protein [Hyphomicrobium sp. D-2]|uniref:outer membrane protein n=1 Tax=Hyphomicrobium sp. D-2 TaxID=3041621 RepID=UPI0024573141|nr:outer membrane beta-barrel protein [Hyphomicrobium sp. D-2]MDH4983498.1 outer membrane beta-barrel protein [Hyphomicrobium sp. D-2]
MAAAQARRFWQCSYLAVTAALSVAAASPARADSTQTDPWNGFYVGAFAGGAWGSGDTTTDVGEVNATSFFTSDENIASIEQNASGKARSGSFTGGVQLGANQRFNQFLIGAEVDFGAFDLNGGRGAVDVPYPTFPGPAYTVKASYSTDWLLTARGRLGWLATPDMLLYFTSGLALSDVKASNEFFDRLVALGPQRATQGASSRTRTKAGYTLGGGIEANLGGPWSIKAEYLYVDLGKVTTKGIVVPQAGPERSPLNTSVDVTANIARVGINYSFSD